MTEIRDGFMEEVLMEFDNPTNDGTVQLIAGIRKPLGEWENRPPPVKYRLIVKFDNGERMDRYHYNTNEDSLKELFK